MSTPTQRPEGALIERLRTEIRPALSGRAAAKAAGLSASRWTQIIRGYKQETPELRVPVRAPADTLARMAKAVGATPEQLKDAGREDAAQELVSLMTVRETVAYERAGGRIEAPLEDRKRLGAGLASLIPRQPVAPVEPEVDEPDFLTGAGLVWELVNELADSPEGDPDREWKSRRAVVGTADVLTDALLRLNVGPAAKQLIQDMSYTAHVIMADQIEAMHQQEGSKDDVEVEAASGTSTKGGPPEEVTPLRRQKPSEAQRAIVYLVENDGAESMRVLTADEYEEEFKVDRQLFSTVTWIGDEIDDAAALELGRSLLAAQPTRAAARTAPHGYRPGQSEQGDAGGDESQDDDGRPTRG